MKDLVANAAVNGSEEKSNVTGTMMENNWRIIVAVVVWAWFCRRWCTEGCTAWCTTPRRVDTACTSKES
jgi:hypothetical protein